ncbi:MAG TPA: alpha/beta hydrolase fold domain-containing protein [Rhizomicrobium sp.]|jgi:acetyl esterase/lipase|nr:alpha/beta hydrolase fold domain-containing protein [Rhizomicrobium sp.]
MIRKAVLWTVAMVLLGGGAVRAAEAPAPPHQPPSGPGGRSAPYGAVVAQSLGSGPQSYWLFEPAKPTPARAPLIVFNHGWGATDPRSYQAWIDHIVERGNIVVYPLYQDSLRTKVGDFTPDAVAAVKDAIRVLQTAPGHVRPELDRFAIVGHSMGGPISANMAADWKTFGLPVPRAVMCMEPGKTWGSRASATFQLADLSQIPSATLLLTVTGDEDRLVGDTDAKRIFYESTRVPASNKNYVTLVSDNHGRPALKANHFAPVAWAPMPEGAQQTGSEARGPLRALLRQRVEEWLRKRAEERNTDAGGTPGATDTNRTLDALDYYGTWKLFDGLTDAAFYGRNRNYALGNTKEQRFMGVWSDGVPVRTLIVSSRP